MKQEHMLMYALVFVLGFVVARMMSGRLVEGDTKANGKCCVKNSECDSNYCNMSLATWKAWDFDCGAFGFSKGVCRNRNE